MNARARFWILALLMVGVCALVMVVMAIILYRHELSQQRELLQVTAQSQARLMEAIARQQIDSNGARVMTKADYAATLKQIVDAHERYVGFGETGEFTLARRADDDIVFVLRHRNTVVEQPAPVPFDSELAEPMRLALKQQSGTTIDLDYRGKLCWPPMNRLPSSIWGLWRRLILTKFVHHSLNPDFLPLPWP